MEKTPKINSFSKESRKKLLMQLEVGIRHAKAQYNHMLKAGEIKSGKKYEVKIKVDDITTPILIDLTDKNLSAKRVFEDYKKRLMQVVKKGRRAGYPFYKQ